MTIYTKHGARRGVTLIEAVLFISIALGLIVGGLVFFQQASLAARTNDAVRSLSGIASETRAAYRTQATFAGVSSAVLISSGAVPSSQIVTTTTGTNPETGAACAAATPCQNITNEWNQPVVIRSSAVLINGAFTGLTNALAPQHQYFEIEYQNIPVAACTRLATATLGNGPIGPGIVGVRITDAAAPTATRPAGPVPAATTSNNVSVTGQVNITPAQAAAACSAGTAPVDVIFTLAR